MLAMFQLPSKGVPHAAINMRQHALEEAAELIHPGQNAVSPHGPPPPRDKGIRPPCLDSKRTGRSQVG